MEQGKSKGANKYSVYVEKKKKECWIENWV
jgi:hypothetical protein